MVDELKLRLGSMITRARPLKPQTERHIHEHLDATDANWQQFFDSAAEKLEEYELEIESEHIDAARAWCLEKFRSLSIEARPSTETKLHRLLRRMGVSLDAVSESE